VDWGSDGAHPAIKGNAEVRSEKGRFAPDEDLKMTRGAYTKPGRLEDVLALIQVLALDEDTHRSLSGIAGELQSTSSSSPDSWLGVAKEHPEFFRIRPKGEHVLSLVARHVLPKNEKGQREMPPGLTQSLLTVAIDLHDRQVEAAERWKSWIPLASAILAALIASGTTLLTLWLSGWCKR
jgi:hypothetical protein